jgi:hypothetical protein
MYHYTDDQRENPISAYIIRASNTFTVSEARGYITIILLVLVQQRFDAGQRI